MGTTRGVMDSSSRQDDAKPRGENPRKKLAFRPASQFREAVRVARSVNVCRDGAGWRNALIRMNGRLRRDQELDFG